MLTRTCILLLLFLVGSALYLVHMQYQWRRLISTLNAEQAEEKKLNDEQRMLLSEIRSLTTAVQMERVAREQLEMHPISSRMTLYVAEDAQGLVEADTTALPAFVAKKRP